MRTAGPYATGVIIRLLALLGPLSAFGPEENNGNFRRQIPRHPSDLQATTTPSGATVRYKEPSKYGLCETTPGVNSYSGFINTSTTLHTYFWFFESRNDPENDPIALWINGGPGSDSLIGVFTGSGPCSIKEDGTTEINPLSWNNVSNVLYISQPVGTGFSYAGLQEASIDELSGQFLNASLANVTGIWPVVNETTIIDTTGDAVVAAWSYVQAFYSALTSINPKIKSKDFHLWTVSWGGHYGPAMFKYFKDQNEDIAAGNAGGTQINLRSLGLGNAYIDTAIQGPYFPEFATKNTYNITAVEGPFRAVSGRDRFDIRLNQSDSEYVKQETPLYAFLNQAEVQDALGVASNYTPEASPVTEAIGELVDAGVNVLLLNGDADYACNWLGGEAVSLAVNYTGAEDFAATDYQPFVVGGRQYGQVRQYGNFAFLRVYEAGHMVQWNRPEAMLDFFNRTIHGIDVATGLEDVSEDPPTDTIFWHYLKPLHLVDTLNRTYIGQMKRLMLCSHLVCPVSGK
ncbi:RTA-like protein [Macrophomina phaseolina MS6]|uniref:RTA-like protein n=1 Tax=Macrophomina phaseolina (strain MS6) TaxID=1126212 RepID=K2RJP6_MACPH|nr:RTA-like protein [Macrophomina phaseolina MS6]